jgi:hypothetical protein
MSIDAAADHKIVIEASAHAPRHYAVPVIALARSLT